MPEEIKRADLVVTGEGQSDEQTMYGKAPGYVAELAKQHNKPALLLSGSLDGDYEKLNHVFTGCFSIVPGPRDLTECMDHAESTCTKQQYKSHVLFRIYKLKGVDSMDGIGLILIIIAGVFFVIVATAKFNLHPFLSLLIAAFAIGISSGMPLPDVVEAVNGRFGGLMGDIGLVTVFGTCIGVILEKSVPRFEWLKLYFVSSAKSVLSWL